MKDPNTKIHLNEPIPLLKRLAKYKTSIGYDYKLALGKERVREINDIIQAQAFRQYIKEEEEEWN